MKYLHAMLRIRNVEESLHFFCQLLGLQEIRRTENAAGRFTLIFLATAAGEPEVELTFNWDVPETYGQARNFGHLAFAVDNIYSLCQTLQNGGVTIQRPPRDGHMAFVRSPDGISVELLQKGKALEPAEPWLSMPNVGTW
ncbi:MAG: VOC family protein [Proteobacteria bacterium]|nr:VOC family protein [Pseudomonadota bacterium]